MPPKKRIIRVNSTDDDVHLVVKEKGLGKDNKSIQATRKEAWSADLSESRTRPTQWQFNKRNVMNEKMQMREDSQDYNGNGDLNGEIKSKHIHDDSTLRMTGPNVIYSREMQNRQHKRKERDIYVEDYDDYTPKSHRRKITLDESETESLRRHEIERGSDRDYNRRIDFEDSGSYRRNLRRQHATSEEEPDGSLIIQDGREQLFIREGNTEILRLLTRGRADDDKELQRPVTYQVRQPQYILVDSGKNILMQRFIEQQLLQQDQRSHAGSELQGSRKGSQNSLHSTADSKKTYNMTREDLLETSLRQQNELLRQILLEKEKLDKQNLETQQESRLETQSLPGHSVIGTQTDCNTATQTEPQYLRPPRRQIRSDNDDSLSDDDFHLYIIKQSDDTNGIRWVKKRRKLKRRRFRDMDKKGRRVVAQIRRHIKTPILEESESPLESKDKSKGSKYKKIRILRKVTTEEMTEPEEEEEEKEGEIKKSSLKKDVLLEISNSLDNKEETKKHHKTEMYYELNSDEEKIYLKRGEISDDSLVYEIEEAITQSKIRFSHQGSSTETRDDTEHRDSAEYHMTQEEERNHKNLQYSQDTDYNDNSKCPTKKKSDSTPRYMQWYNKNGKPKDNKEKENMKKIKKSSQKPKSMLADTKSSSIKKVFPTERKTEDEDEERPQRKGKKDSKSSTEGSSMSKDQSKTFHPLTQHSEYRYEHPSQIPPPIYPQTVQYMTTTPVGIPAPVVTLIPTHLAPIHHQQQPQQISVQPREPTPRHKTPEKPPRNSVQNKQTETGVNVNNKQQPLLKAPGGIEEDYDSGIAMASLVQDAKKKSQIEKKSIFTIAYDEMPTKKLLPDSSTPPF